MTDNLSRNGFTLIYKNGLPLITDDRLTSFGVQHGFTTRLGGVSQGEFCSLNLAYSPDRNDSEQNVDANYRLLLAAFDTLPQHAVKTNQQHTDNVISDPVGGTGFVSPGFDCGVDGLVTRQPGVLLTARMADCLPVLLYDVATGAVGAVHSGWKGTFQRIVPKAVALMTQKYGTRPSDLLVSFGPSIGSCCYQVGHEFKQRFVDEFGRDMENFFEQRPTGLYADMRGINAYLLRDVGIPLQSISVYPACTCCNPDFFFSYRRQGAKRGTLAAVIKCR